MLKTVRKTLFWFHLIAGCIGGIVILLMSITGVLLTYERQMIASAERGPFIAKSVPEGAQPLQIEELLAQVSVKSAPTVTIRSAPGEPVELNLGREGIIYVDPYTARTLGSPEKGTREFFQKLRAWHRWLAWEGEWRAWGKAITGACTLAFVGLVLSGLYLWIPKTWTWQHLRPITWFRAGLSGKARDFNWHNALGLWSAVPLFFVIISALPISYPWANKLIYQVTGTEMPKAEPPASTKGQPNFARLNAMLQVAQQQPAWQSISFRVAPGEAPVPFTIDRGDGGQPQLKSTLTLDRSTATVVKQESFADFNTGRQIRMFSRFLHTGESLGLIGQSVAGIASAAGVVLVWTGLALAWRRFQNWRKRSTTKALEPEPETVAV
jgi:uncharacterized iron-regulated membrane protein